MSDTMLIHCVSQDNLKYKMGVLIFLWLKNDIFYEIKLNRWDIITIDLIVVVKCYILI